MSKLSRAEETILENQKIILKLLVGVYGGDTNIIFHAHQRIGYTEQFIKDNGNG